MNVEEFRDYCLSLKGATEKMPFRNVPDKYSSDVLCFYIGNKWFCYVNIAVFDRCCLKSVPDDAIDLRNRYEGVRPAWHMNKKMWNDVYFNEDVPDNVIKTLVRNSYDLVFNSLAKKEREEVMESHKYDNPD